ncbi:unnamed protein product, partial [Brassica rapa subsp. narinosa]
FRLISECLLVLMPMNIRVRKLGVRILMICQVINYALVSLVMTIFQLCIGGKLISFTFVFGESCVCPEL